MSEKRNNEKERSERIANITAEVMRSNQYLIGVRVSESSVIDSIAKKAECSRQTAWKYYQQWLTGIIPQRGGKRKGAGRRPGSKNKPKSANPGAQNQTNGE